MYKYYVYTTLIIKDKKYQHLDIYGCMNKIPEDLIRDDIITKYFKEIFKCDKFILNIIKKRA